MIALMDHVAQDVRGPRGLGTDLAHQISGEIYEFIKGDVRVFWFYDKGNVVICSHGIVKKGQKTPKKDIEAAERVFREYFSEKKAGKKLEDLILDDEEDQDNGC